MKFGKPWGASYERGGMKQSMSLKSDMTADNE